VPNYPCACVRARIFVFISGDRIGVSLKKQIGGRRNDTDLACSPTRRPVSSLPRSLAKPKRVREDRYNQQPLDHSLHSQADQSRMTGHPRLVRVRFPFFSCNGELRDVTVRRHFRDACQKAYAGAPMDYAARECAMKNAPHPRKKFIAILAIAL